MRTESMTVRCEHGLHARVAVRIVEVARGHQSAVHIRCDGCTRADACSVLQLLMLGAAAGTTVEVEADGADEDTVIDQLTEVFSGGAGI